ncbi:MAG TPA: PD-(D/E)XK nuclease family protein [Oculatellaceae cyanobacterium]|jgi:hypothetical protein
MKFTPHSSPLIRLSQGYLNLLEACPRKFQHIYFDQLGSLPNIEQQDKQNWGSRFHLLMQQRELGLPIQSFVEEDAQLQRWVTSLISAAPEILTSEPETFRQSEHCRTLSIDSYVLTVIYDLLIADHEKAQILDWKTYPKPKHQRWLAKDWQTRLYLYVLAETSDYLPEQISMTYWFVQSQPQPESLKFTYNATLHEQTKRDLTSLLKKLTDWLRRYQEIGENFPQVSATANLCHYCNFTVRCERSPEVTTTTNREKLSNLAEIQEVSL